MYYRNLYFCLVLIPLFSGCVILSEPEEKIIGPIAYSHQVSKKEIELESGSSLYKSSISIATLTYDSTVQIVYFKKSIQKKYHGEYYSFSETKVDTLILTHPDSTFIRSQSYLSGNFVPPIDKFQNWRWEDRGIKFSSDGFCVITSVSNCSDSPCSTTTQTNGRYRTAGDTIYVTYFLTRSFYHGWYNQDNNSIKSIDEVSWNVREPISVSYVLSQTNDTLYTVKNSNYYLLGSDSLIRTEVK